MAFLFLRFRISFDYIPEDIGRTREQHFASRTKDAGKCWTLEVSCYNMDVLPKILARKDLFQLGEQLQRKYLVSTLEDGTTTVNGIVFKTNDKGRALLTYRKHELKLR